ncbi:uncharacterized protein B0J16DRAFT_327935 [Fusarium flagelliforme]|uniref:Uncharacterized protein n=1 Tax=Fusarium flagelliforme TaxID=2675880 RepID=A0A395MZU3_9HYPO|nr:uncharacterized protein B0J16DRAFT_327935 [Fusarium flagelliforme]KAH7197324.1 hypothetical protein B0J16DRAFT_327935 [Fusarium flagelliforme]RFN53376.1 hypothetical protein FIE12Z_2371 [Fusarium flagelliforme]
MRGSITLLLALSASYTTVTALPKPRVQPRDDAGKPKYSVVPLEPGDDDPASGGTGSGDGNGSSGSGDGDGDGVVTVIRTVVQTPKPVTQVITRTGNPSIVTAPGKTVTKAVPTTVAVINVSDDPVVTQTVTVPRSSASKPKSTEEPSATQEPETTDDEVKPTAQEPSDSLSSAPAPGVTPQPEPQPQPKPQPNPQPNPQPEPQPEPEPSTSIASAESIETSSTKSDIQTFPAVVTVTLRFPTSESLPTDSEPTTLATQATQDAEAPENTSSPSWDSSVAPMPPQETFVQDPAGNNGETLSTATLPYYAPVAPTTLLTSWTTSTTSSDVHHITPEPVPSSKTPEDGSWRTTYPPWSDDLAI